MIRHRFGIMVLVLFLMAAFIQADEIRTLTGKTITGSVEKITDKEILLKTPAGPVTTSMAQVLELSLRAGRSQPTEPQYIEVQLLDDSLLRCTKVVFGAKEATLTLTSGVSLKVPLAAFFTVLREANNENIRAQFSKLLKMKTNRDRIFISRMGDLNPIEGTLSDIDEAKQTIKFKRTEGDIEPELEKLHGLQFVRTQTAAETAMCKIIDTDGNQLVASKLMCDGTQFNLTTPYGAKLALDMKWVAKVDFNFGKFTYLSDLDAKMPVSMFLGGFNPMRKDANLDGLPLILQDKKYDKGLSMYSGTELEYNLAGKYKEFKAVVGADSRIAEEGQGKVTVSVYCDRKRVLTQEVSTKAVVPIAVNVKDVESLRIVVSGSNFTNYSGHATLADAHVTQ